MEIITNLKHKLFCIKSSGELDPLKVAIEDISDDGHVTFRGFAPDTQVLLTPGISIILRDRVSEGILVRATILKIDSKSVYNCSPLTSDDGAALEMTIDALCDIEFCSFFEPVLYKATD